MEQLLAGPLPTHETYSEERMKVKVLNQIKTMRYEANRHVCVAALHGVVEPLQDSPLPEL